MADNIKPDQPRTSDFDNVSSNNDNEGSSALNYTEMVWSLTELRTLRSAVKASMLQNKLQPLLDRYIFWRLIRCAVNILSSVFMCFKFRSLPEDEILVGDYSNIDWARIATTELLMCAVSRLGAKDWSKVAKAVPGRADGQCRERTDMVRRRYHTLLTTKMRLCVAQLDRIRLSSVSSKVSAAVHNIRRNRVFRQFNEMVNGDDETGEKLCEQVREQTFREPTGRQLFQMKQRMNILTDEEKAIVEKGIEAIAQKYRDGDQNINVFDLVKGIELTERLAFSTILLLNNITSGCRIQKLFRQFDPAQMGEVTVESEYSEMYHLLYYELMVVYNCLEDLRVNT
uniref:SANT domain-containing protein n=1 Tax=Heterorhabditis bacteriophora TaxID=37862 RepID=A0A1I7XD58_HETBA